MSTQARSLGSVTAFSSWRSPRSSRLSDSKPHSRSWLTKAFMSTRPYGGQGCRASPLLDGVERSLAH